MSLKTTLKALGDAIRGKAGVTGAMTLEQMTTAVNGINVGVDTSDANAAAGDLLSGKTAYVGGKKVTGTIPSKAAATFTPGTADQTIAAGMYLSGKQTIKGDANLLPENIAQGVSIFGVNGINVGVDTSDANAAAGDLLSGKTAYAGGVKLTGTIPSQGAQTITPGTSDQTIAAGKYLSGAQTVLGDPNLLPENIAQGVSLFGVAGALASGAIKGATGTVSIAQWSRSVTVSGLDFDPKVVYLDNGASKPFAADVDGLVVCITTESFTHSQGTFTISVSLTTSNTTATWYAIGC